MATVNKTMKTFNVPSGSDTICYEIFDDKGRKCIAKDWYANSTAKFSAGECVIKDGVCYKFKVDHAANSPWSASEVVATNLGSELSDVKSALDTIIRETVTTYDPDMSDTVTYYNTSGSTILMSDGAFTKSTGSTRSDNWSIPVSAGDVFYITATGKGSGAYAFIGELHTTYADVNSRYGVNSTVTNEKVTIPNSITYLIVNNYDVGNGMVKKVISDPIVYESDLDPVIEDIEVLSKGCKCKYSTRTIEYSSMRECLDVYVPAKVGYVDYVFGRTQTNATQAEGGGNVWRLVEIDAVYDNFQKRFKITQLGETEMAIKIFGRSDFIGGSTHGDEWMDDNSLLFTIDGLPVDIETVTELRDFTELRCFLVSNLYDPDDHTTLIGIHGREWVFNENGLYIGQTVEFKANLTMSESYMPMICALRGNDTASALQITDTYTDDGNYQRYDVGTGGFTSYPNQLKKGIKKVNLFGHTSGVGITVDYIEFPDNLNKGGNFLYNGVNTYNKIYNCLCGYGNSQANTQSVTTGDKWTVKAKIKVDIGI